MKSWLRIVVFVLACVVPARAGAFVADDANRLGTARGEAPRQDFVADSVGSSTNESAVAAVTSERIVVVGLSVSNAHSAACLIEFRNDTSSGAVLWSANVLPGYVAAVTAPAGGYLFKTGISAALNIKNSCGATTYYNVQYLTEGAVAPTPTPTPSPTPSPTPTPTP